MKTVEYDYIKKDLMLSPEKYQMSPFEGLKFLDAYRKSREIIIQTLDMSNDSLNTKIAQLLDIINQDKNETLNQEQTLTKQLLMNICIKNSTGTHINDVDIIDLFIKKFEVKRRIFTYYDKQYNEVSVDYLDLTNYVLLSINCIFVYMYTNNLKYLNTVLKLNDLIISRLSYLNDKNLQLLFTLVLERELCSIHDLCKKKGIEL